MSKKVLRSIALITMIVLAFSVSAAAIGFKPSVDIKKGPDYVTPDGFQYEVIITPIGEADNQTDERVQEGLKHLKNVYEDLKDKNITDIVDKAALEKASGTKAENLKVSDMFDLWTNSPETIALKFKEIIADGEKFAALYRDYNGNWKILNATVDGINVNIDGLTNGTVVFLTAEKGSSTPDTSDYTNSWMWIAVAGVAVVGIAVLAVCLVRSKKQENN
jgi:hypothetical protein